MLLSFSLGCGAGASPHFSIYRAYPLRLKRQMLESDFNRQIAGSPLRSRTVIELLRQESGHPQAFNRAVQSLVWSRNTLEAR